MGEIDRIEFERKGIDSDQRQSQSPAVQRQIMLDGTVSHHFFGVKAMQMQSTIAIAIEEIHLWFLFIRGCSGTQGVKVTHADSLQLFHD